jgi:hypothetical protein
MRSRGFNLGCITYLHLAVRDFYFLRLLLNHIKGLTWFADLRKVDEIVYPTF